MNQQTLPDNLRGSYVVLCTHRCKLNVDWIVAIERSGYVLNFGNVFRGSNAQDVRVRHRARMLVSTHHNYVGEIGQAGNEIQFSYVLRA